MYALIVILHVIACFALILIVLLQTGRGAEMGAAFGGASQTLFGGTGTTSFLSKLTTAAAVVFMLTCLGLSYVATGHQSRSIMQNVPIEKPQGPSLPEAKPVQPAPPGQEAGKQNAAAARQGGAEGAGSQGQNQAAPSSQPKAEDKSSGGMPKQ
jgi:preprotein translocase subunit SecG